jgi:phosphoglycerate kinase
MKSIKSITHLKNKYVLVRADLNVPLEGGKVRDDFRISKVLPTLSFLQKKGAKIIVISHLGEKGESLAPVAKALAKKIERVSFVGELIGEKVLAAKESMKGGDILVLENLRTDAGEKEGSKEFAKALATLGEVYVNDAFSASHRKHASITVLPKLLPAYAGLQLEAEVKTLSKALDPKHPFVFILGGAKISTKLPLLSKYKKTADSIFVGGALANDFYKTKKLPVGLSLTDGTDVPKNILTAKNIFIPYDVITNTKRIIPVSLVEKDEYIYDAGPAFIAEAKEKIAKAKMILVNGPLGNYEAGFDAATKALLKEIAAQKKAVTIVGGGDSVALVQKLKLEKEFSFVSTGGGAMLEFLAKGKLPGVDALR